MKKPANQIDGTPVRADRRRFRLPGIGLPLALAVFLACAVHAHSDGSMHDGDASASPIAAAPVRPAPADPAIQRALAQVSAVHIQHTIQTLAGFRNRNTLGSMDTDLPSGQGVSSAADWIEAELRGYSAACGGCLEVRRDTFTEPAGGRFPRPTTITNVYAILRGVDPIQSARKYLVTGHYDSRGTDVLDTHKEAPGANDDASGVAVSLECARVLSQLKLPATLVFVAVAGEEQGLNGSAHLAQLARAEGWQLEGVLNNDIVGGDTTPGDRLQDKSDVRVFSEGIPAAATPEQVRAMTALGGENDSPSRELARAVADVAATYSAGPARTYGGRHVPATLSISTGAGFHPVLEFRRDRFLRGGDHTSFNHEGFAAVRFTEWRENFNHQHQDVRTEKSVEFGDLLKFVDFDYVARVARLNAATLAVLASAPPPPQDLRIETSALDNNTTLHWAPTDQPAVHFEVVWRATSAPDWEFSQPCDRSCETPSGNTPDRITLTVSKDNFIFGVRSVDAAGHRSIVVIPVPER